MSKGAPSRSWGLDCPSCEAVLRGDRKQKIIHVVPGDKDKGIPGRTVHVNDADPHWSSTPEGIPLTPDEQHVFKLRAEQGKQQLDMLTAFATLKQGGVEIPEQARWLIDRTLEEIARPIVKGNTVCGNGHDNNSGARFCVECGIPMNGKAQIEPRVTADFDPIPPQSVIPLDMLHIATLRKRCREKGLNDKGTKAQLIGRLSA